MFETLLTMMQPAWVNVQPQPNTSYRFSNTLSKNTIKRLTGKTSYRQLPAMASLQIRGEYSANAIDYNQRFSPVMIAKSSREESEQVRNFTKWYTYLGIVAPAASQAWINAEPIKNKISFTTIEARYTLKNPRTLRNSDLLPINRQCNVRPTSRSRSKCSTT